ncbi:MAG: membrane protein insertion efficiency factor YidD [Candidatus Kerfeldbacteria bacterium]|nr:membrane protein insertion efficiency factor YidD [Candidatus Kerfeldbacteria bacterium]
MGNNVPMSIASRALLFTIRLYQRTLSPDHGWWRARHPLGFCRFSPTCSDYAVAAVERLGLIKGLWRAIGRILRCNPWTRGGLDPVR